MQRNEQQIQSTYDITQYDLGLGDIISSLYGVHAFSRKRHYPPINFYVKQFHEWVSLFDIPNLNIVHRPSGDVVLGAICLGDKPAEYAYKLKHNQTSKQWYANKLDGEVVPLRLKKIHETAEPIFKDKYIVLAPFATRSTRTWNIDNWKELAAHFTGEGYKVIALDSKNQPERCKKIGVKYYWGMSADWVANVCLHAQLLITNDSGLAHLGGAIGSKTLVIMSHLDPAQIYGYTDNHIITPETSCTGCRFQADRGYLKQCDRYCHALNSISPSKVFIRAKNILKGRSAKLRKRLLAVSEVCIGTGFSRVTEEVLTHLSDRYDIIVAGMNLRAVPDDHGFPFKIVKADRFTGDHFGLNTIPGLMRENYPDKVLVINDAPVCAAIINRVAQVAMELRLPLPKICCYVPVDGEIFSPGPYKFLLDHGQLVTYTYFAVNQIRRSFELNKISVSNLEQKLSIARHCIDRNSFYPIDLSEAREVVNNANWQCPASDRRINIPADAFVVGWINRNQPRKNLASAIHSFSVFAAGKRNCYLLIKADFSDYGGNFIPLLQHYGILEQTLILNKRIDDPKQLNAIYNAIDVFLSSSVAEGWGLTEHEAAACAKPLVLPSNTVRPELWGGVARLVKAEVPVYNPAMCMSMGWIMDTEETVNALTDYYNDSEQARSDGRACYNRAIQFGEWAQTAQIIQAALSRPVNNYNSAGQQNASSLKEVEPAFN